MDEKRAVFKQLLSTRYIIQAVVRGAKYIYYKKRLRRAAAVCLSALVILCVFTDAFATGPLAGALAALYRIALVSLLVFVGPVFLWWLGNPNDFIKIEFALTKIGLTNAAGEIPILLSRTLAGAGRGEVWELEAYGIPLSAFNDAAEKLEAALDIALVSADTGSNGRRVRLHVVPHPGPWPEVLKWDRSKMPSRNAAAALGENRGQLIQNDFSVTPHLLLAGQTGSGKSVLLKCLMLQFFLKGWRVYLIDYKRGADYGRSWEDRCELVTEDEALLKLLEDVCAEMERRLELFHEKDCPNIDVCNSKCGAGMPRIAVCFDEVAEALEKSSGMSREEKERKEKLSHLLSSIARLGRAAGIHLVLATQRGSAEVLSGQIRSNVQAVCGIANENLSILTLGTADAHKRIPKTARGRFLTEEGVMFHSYFSDFGEADFTGRGN